MLQIYISRNSSIGSYSNKSQFLEIKSGSKKIVIIASLLSNLLYFRP